MDFEIRQILEQDIPILAEFEKEISIISFGDDAITENGFHEQKIRKSFSKNRNGMFVLLADGEIGGWLWMDSKTNYLTQDTYINFRSFYIVENLRGGTAGSNLMKTGMEYCKKINARSIVGKVHTDNIAMRALYKNFGFRPTHLTMEYYATEDN